MLEVLGWIFFGVAVLVFVISALEPLFKRIK